MSNAILFGGVWLLGQLVSPDEFGRYSVAVAFALTVYPVLTLRLEQAVPIAVEEATARGITLVCFALSAGLLTLLYFFLSAIAASSLLAAYLPRIGSDLLLPTVALALTLSLGQIVQSFALREGALHNLAMLRVLRAVALVGFQLLLVLTLGGSAGAMLGGEAAANALLAVILAARLECLPWLLDATAWCKLPRQFGALLRRYREFPLVNLPHAVTHNALSTTYAALIGTLYGGAALGQYYMMNRVLFGAIGLISTALYQQGVAEAARREAGRLREVFRYIFLSLLITTILVAIPVFLVGDNLFVFVLGESWAQAGELAGASVLRIVMEPIAAALAFAPVFLNKQRQAFAWAVVQNATGILLLMFVNRFGGNVEAAVGGSATGMAIVMMAYVAWLWWHLGER